MGLLWQKLWHRESKAKPPADETPAHKKARQLAERKANRNRPFESKESYRWVEAMKAVQAQLQKVEKHLQETKQQRAENLEPINSRLRIVHVFDREGDIAEVFERVHQSERTGVVVRAAHNRSLDTNNTHLWEHLSAQPIQEEQEVELPATAKRAARTALLAMRFAQVQLRPPRSLSNQDPFKVYAVYALGDCSTRRRGSSFLDVTHN